MTEAWESLFCGVVVFGLEESGILQMGEHGVLGNIHEVKKQGPNPPGGRCVRGVCTVGNMKVS